MTRFSSLSAALVVCTVAFSSCDSSRSNTAIENLDGRYSVAQIVFDPSAAALPDADVGARLRPSGTTLQIFGGDGSVLFQTQFDNGAASRRTDLTATATRGRVTFVADAAEDERELADLFLPRQFTLTYEADSPRTLTGDINLQNVNLQNFDVSQYQGLTDVSGTLRVRLDRVVN